MKNNVIICQPKILPTIYINSNTQSNYNYSSHQYSTTTNQIKTISNTPYQTYTTPVYYNYNQNSNTYTSNYSGELERQTYKNTPNIKIAENYGIIDQNNLQKLQVQKRPSAGMTQNYNLKSSGGGIGSEFRINQMGPIYRDYSVMPGDEITITHFETNEQINNVISVKTFNRVVIIVYKKGAEIINIERLSNYQIGDRGYSLTVNYQGRDAVLDIAFLGLKRNVQIRLLIQLFTALVVIMFHYQTTHTI